MLCAAAAALARRWGICGVQAVQRSLLPATCSPIPIDGPPPPCHRSLDAAAIAFGLHDCWQWKPVLDGRTVMAAFGWKSGGPALGRAMDRVLDWQLAHPRGSAEECRAWLLQQDLQGEAEEQRPAKRR